MKIHHATPIDITLRPLKRGGWLWYAALFEQRDTTELSLVIPLSALEVMSDDEILSHIRLSKEDQYYRYALSLSMAMDMFWSGKDEMLSTNYKINNGDIEFIYQLLSVADFLCKLKYEKVSLYLIPRMINLFEALARNTPNGGYVYLLQSPTKYYKIGRTKNPSDRLKTFSVKLPFEVEYIHLIPTDDAVEAEAKMHEHYAHCRVNGEWFELSPEDVNSITKQIGMSTKVKII